MGNKTHSVLSLLSSSSCLSWPEWIFYFSEGSFGLCWSSQGESRSQAVLGSVGLGRSSSVRKATELAWGLGGQVTRPEVQACLHTRGFMGSQPQEHGLRAGSRVIFVLQRRGRIGLAPGRGQGLHSAQPPKSRLCLSLGGPGPLEPPSQLRPWPGSGTWQCWECESDPRAGDRMCLHRCPNAPSLQARPEAKGSRLS